MKHFNHLFSALLLMVVLTTASCSGDFEEHPLSQAHALAPTSLIQTLDSINNSLVPQATLRSPKGGELTNKDKTTIAIADAGGAISGGKKGFKYGGRIGSLLGNPATGATVGTIVGAVVKGGMKSYLKYKKIEDAKKETAATSLRRANQTVDDYARAAFACSALIGNGDSLNVNGPLITYANPMSEYSVVIDDSLMKKTNLTDRQLNVGMAHNLVLAYLDGKILIDDASKVDTTTNIYVQKLLESPEFREECLQEDSDEDSEETSAMVEQLFFEVYERYANDCDDVSFIINKYVEAIDASDELSPEEKTSLKYGFATALYSTNYWEKELK